MQLTSEPAFGQTDFRLGTELLVLINYCCYAIMFIIVGGCGGCGHHAGSTRRIPIQICEARSWS